eukprot:12872131-Ditylum_brightwellii.AAC.1
MDANDMLTSLLLIPCVPRAISRSSVPSFVLDDVDPVPWLLVIPLGDATCLRFFAAVMAVFEAMACL